MKEMARNDNIAGYTRTVAVKMRGLKRFRI